MRYVDLETGEIRTLIPYRVEQARRVREARPLWQTRKTKTKRLTHSRWAYKLMAHLGPLVILAISALVVMTFGR